VNFSPTPLTGAFIIESKKLEDERGFFLRSWDANEFSKSGLNPNLAQCNTSYTKIKGTIRGLHYQISPHEESKLIWCIKGEIFDVIVDLRPESKTFKKWFSIQLTSDNYKMLYVPEGFANGFQSLKDEVKIFYQNSQYYASESERGIRWNDPTFNINWPLKPTLISKKDKSWKNFQE